MRRRYFLKYAGTASAISVPGCLSDRSSSGSPDNGSPEQEFLDLNVSETLPDHTRWLYDPDDIEADSEDDWYGYILTKPSDIPSEHPWSRLYERFGIDMNLKHYAIDTDAMENAYSGIDVTRYSSDESLMNEDPYEEIDASGLESGREILADRPASTGGRLEDQEVVRRIGGFEVFERGAALNRSERILVSGLQEYVRNDVIPAIIETGSGDVGGAVGGDYYELWDYLDTDQYVEVGLNPTELPTYPNFHTEERTAFGRSNRILSEDEVEVKQIEMFSSEEAVDDEYMLSEIRREDVDEARQEGRAMVYETVVDGVVTAFMD